MECVNVGITHLSPAGTYFQEVEPVLRTFHEFFVSNGPSCRYRREVTKTVAFGKVARTVCTQSSIDHISFFPVPTQSAEIGHLAALGMRIATGTQAVGRIGGRSVAHKSMLPIIKTFFQHTIFSFDISALVTIGFHTQQGVERMFSHSPVIRSRIGPCHTQRVIGILRYGSTFFIIYILAELVERLETTVFAGTINHTEYRLYLQILDRLQFSINITGKSSRFVLIVAVGHH